MHTFHDRRTECLWITQGAHGFLASLALVFGLLFASFAAIPLWDPDPILWLIVAVGVAAGIYLLRWSALMFTEVVAKFDGDSRALTLSRRQLWRYREMTFPYRDVVAVEVRESTGFNGSGAVDFPFIWPTTCYGLEIEIADGRRIKLRAENEAECHDAARQVMSLEGYRQRHACPAPQ